MLSEAARNALRAFWLLSFFDVKSRSHHMLCSHCRVGQRLFKRCGCLRYACRGETSMIYVAADTDLCLSDSLFLEPCDVVRQRGAWNVMLVEGSVRWHPASADTKALNMFTPKLQCLVAEKDPQRAESHLVCVISFFRPLKRLVLTSTRKIFVVFLCAFLLC